MSVQVQEFTVSHYNRFLVLIHWFMAVGLLVAVCVGLYMVSIPGITPIKLKLYNWHKWLGVSLFFLILVRIVVRSLSRVPAYPDDWSKRQAMWVKLGHFALYVCMVLVPIWGYLFSLAAGFPVVWLGLIELPTLIEKNAELKELFRILHESFSKVLIVLIVGHIVMALKHHFMNQERLLDRMKFVSKNV